MTIRRCARAILALLILASTPATGLAAGGVLNKEGIWEVVVHEDTCMTTMHIEGGSVLGFFASSGGVSFMAFPAGKAPKGKSGVMATETARFAFAPVVERGHVTMDDELNDEAIAALRSAHQVRILVDGKMALGAELEGTGFPQALDGMIACSKGEKGWWGDGARLAQAPAAWAVKVGDDGVCTAMAQAADGAALVLAAGPGGVVAMVGAKARRGRAGLMEVDGAGFDFAPAYDGPDFFSAGLLGVDSLQALARAKDVRVSVDGREVLNLHVADTGLDAALTRLGSCVPKPAGKRG
jgi:hypothetical protein